MLSIFCDGSSTGRSDKPGGWAFVIVRDGMPLVANYGGSKRTTNNIQEVMGAIKGLQALISNNWHTGNMVELVSDSQYTLGIATGSYSPQKNIEICKELKLLFQKAQAQAKWVRGHSNNEWNSRCDSLAKQGKLEAPLHSSDSFEHS